MQMKLSLKGLVQIMKKRQFNLFARFIVYGLRVYLKILNSTVNFNIDGLEKLKNHQMVGYWHGDSLPMELFLSYTKNIEEINVIVTADRRGDYIEQVISDYGANGIRLPDGMNMRPFFRELIEYGKCSKGILAASLDGPLGPFHEPKKLLFLLAERSHKELIYMDFTYKRVLHLKKRWDNYVILFPFSKVNVKIESMGIITKKDLNQFNNIKEKLRFS